MDKVVKGFACEGQVRLIGAVTTDLVYHSLTIHRTSPVATAALGRLLTAGVLMGATLKNDTDRLTLMMKGNGPIGNMVVCANSKTIVKGYVENPFVDLPMNELGKLDVGSAVGKTGTLTVIKDMGLKEPYSGSIDIVTGEIGDEISKYFVVSEQIPTATAVGVMVKNDATVSAAGGFLLQLMPETDPIIIDMIEDRIKNMRPISSLIKEGFSIVEILRSVSGDDNVEVLGEYDPKFMCDCSRERMEQALITIPIEERERMKKEDGYVEMRCSFCGRTERW